MRRHTMIVVLIFMMPYLGNDGLFACKSVVPMKGYGKIKYVLKKVKEIAEFVPTPKATIAENTKSSKPVVEEVSLKQKDVKPKKPSAAEERIRKLIEAVKEERLATKEEIAAEQQLMQEITGLIIEETMTKIGYEFYEYFFLIWEPPQTVLKYYNIVITERASPVWGSLVEIKIGENIVWSIVLRPRSEEIEYAAKQAIEATKNYLQDYEKYQLKTIDMMGTGI
jgi:curli production assembly/transport component CsgE